MNITSLGIHFAKAIRIKEPEQLDKLGTWIRHIEVETEDGDLFEITLFSDELLEVKQAEHVV
jgi:hypothetical protein